MPTKITDRPDGMVPQVAPRVPGPSLVTRPTGRGVGEGQEIPGVSGRLKGLLSSRSPYMQRARTRATQLANRRGLMSSSIAAGAGEAAAIDAALPIAQADAAIAEGERGRVSQELMQQRNLRVQQLMQERGFTHEQAMSEAGREFAGRQAALDRAAQRYMFDSGMSHEAAQAEAQRKFAGVQADLDRETQRLMQERGLSYEEAQSLANRELKQRNSVQTATQFAQDQYQQSLDRLALNTDIPAEERARLEEHYAFLRDQAIDAIRAIYGVELSWAQSTRPPPEEEAA